MDIRLPTRRAFGLWGAASLLAPSLPAYAQQPARPWLGDMHSHYGMFGNRLGMLDVRRHLEQTGTTLLAWALVDDTPFTESTGRGIEQVKTPAPGELWAYLKRRVARYDDALRVGGLSKALTPADVDAAVAGKPTIVMASESANFLEGQPERLAEVHAMGLRHLQLVHFIDSPLGDRQTSEPKLSGLSPAGVQTVRECKRLGILVDLAHCTPAAVDAALAAGEGAAMVWSHSWVRGNAPTWRDWPYVARALPLEHAKKIAAQGGVVGLWSARVKSDRSYTVRDADTYADEILRMVDKLGPKHVAFGTDMEGAGKDPVLSNYTDLRQVADRLAQLNVPGAVLHDVCIGNYARVLKQAMAGAAKT